MPQGLLQSFHAQMWHKAHTFSATYRADLQQQQQHLQHIQLSTHAHTHRHTQQDRVDTLHTDTGDCRSSEETGEEPEAEAEPEACLLGGDWTVVIDDD